MFFSVREGHRRSLYHSSRLLGHLSRHFLPFAVVTTIAACGGGGGGGSSDGGPDSTEGDPSAIVNATETIDAGDECPAGGIRVHSGIDENGNGELNDDEVNASTVVCNGSEGVSTLVGLTAIEPGSTCPAGGTRIDSGPDTNGNGELDDDEIETNTSVCNGDEGDRNLVAVTSLESGSECPTGGVRIESGLDEDGDSTLAGDEVDASQTVCNGSDGSESLVALSPIQAGPECIFSGTRIESGIDENGDGVLDGDEVSTEQVLCGSGQNAFSGLAFTADKSIDGLDELWQTTVSGGATKVAAPAELAGALATFEINGIRRSPDGNHIAFMMRDNGTADEPWHLYVADLRNNDDPVRVSGEIPANGGVSRFAWSPDGSRIAYLADEDTVDEDELHTVLPDGTGRATVNDPLPSGGTLSTFHWAPNGSRLLYRGEGDTADQSELYTARPDGSDNVKLNEDLDPDVQVGTVVRWAPDTSRVAYIAAQNDPDTQELYTVRPDGTDNTKVSGTPVAGGEVIGSALEWAPDGSRLAYMADQDVDEVTELYTTDPDNNANVAKMNADLAPEQAVSAFTVAWAPDSSRIAYVADQDTEDVHGVYTTRANGDENVRVSGDMPAGAEGAPPSAVIQWAPDSSRIAYRADQGIAGTLELYTVEPDGAGNTRINGTLPGEGEVRADYAWAPDGTHLAYLANQESVDVEELYVATPDGSDNTKVNGDLVSGGDVEYSRWEWGPDGSHLAYIADQESEGMAELYTVQPDGSENIRVSGDLAPGGEVTNFSW